MVELVEALYAMAGLLSAFPRFTFLQLLLVHDDGGGVAVQADD